MKKNGFTLAEVMITLAITVIVATLTLPALMSNTERQAISGFKKGIKTLTEAGQRSYQIEGFDYGGLVSESDASKQADAAGNAERSLFGLLANTVFVDLNRTGVVSDTNSGWKSYQDGTATGDDNFVIFFRDGACLSFSANATSNTNGANEIQADGLPYGIEAIYDYNGVKSPNIVSNCQNNAGGVADDALPDDTNLAEYCSRERRVIKDQFGVRLRGMYAVPNGAAAQWAMAQ